MLCIFHTDLVFFDIKKVNLHTTTNKVNPHTMSEIEFYIGLLIYCTILHDSNTIQVDLYILL